MKYELVGYVGVDSGQVMICDPCYINSEWQKTKKGEDIFDKKNMGKFSYSGCCSATLSEKQYGQLNYKLGHAGAGVASSTKDGDGSYPVYATKNKKGEIISLTIEF